MASGGNGIEPGYVPCRPPPPLAQGQWLQWAGAGLALVSGVAALAMLLLPLLLVLLMVLFDSTAHGIVVLLGLLLSWLREFMPGGGGMPPFRTVTFHPLEVALASLLRALPCLAGLMLILLDRRPGARWWWIVLLWGCAAVIGGKAVAAVLLPGLVVAMVFALPLAARRRR